MLPAEDNGSHMYELEVSQRLKPQGGNATILPPEMRLTQADINFLTGGTQTNQTVIDSLLKNYEGVIAAQTGHVNVHEAGAIEFTGHKEIFGCQQNNSQLVLLSGRSGV